MARRVAIFQALSLFLLALLIHLAYGQMIPPWQGPDEPRHFEYAALVADRITSDTPAALALQRDILRSMEETHFWELGYFITPYDPADPPKTFEDVWPGFAHESHQFPLYYQIVAGVLRRLPAETPVAEQLAWSRRVSALMGALVVVCAWALARSLFPQPASAAPAIALGVALLPMHAFINGVLNNDSLVILVVSIELLAAVRLLAAGKDTHTRLFSAERWPWLILLLASAGLSLITKRTGLVAPLIALATLLAAGWDLLRRQRRALIGLLAGLVVLLAAGAALLVLARPALAQIWSGYLHLPPQALRLLQDGSYAESLLLTPYPYYTRLLFESFWARFGWMNVRLPDAWYWALGLFCALAGAGVLLRIFHRKALEPYQRRTLLVFLFSIAAAYGIIIGKEVLYLSYQVGAAPQGRYLFPLVAAFFTLLWAGLDYLTPARLRPYLPFLLCLLGIAFQGICIVSYILPHYYGA